MAGKTILLRKISGSETSPVCAIVVGAFLVKMVGNKKNYDEIDVLRLFLRINGKIARTKLTKEMQLGEGSIKGILTKLKQKKLIVSTNKGHKLTQKGIKIKGQLFEQISQIKKIKLDVFHNLTGQAILIRNANKKISYKVRDVAIRVGAEAALLFKYDKRLFLAQCEQDLIDTSSLDKIFKFTQGDVCAVVFAKENNVIEKALLNIAYHLNEKVLI